jgi:hypothetical protein
MGRKNFRRTLGKSNVMYCVQVTITFIGEDEPSTVYLRFRPHGMDKGYSPWTTNPREAKFWLYKNWPYAWLNMENRHLTGQVLCVVRDDDVLRAQKEMR